MSDNTPAPTPLSSEAKKRIYAFAEFSYPPPFQPTAEQTRALFEHLGEQDEADGAGPVRPAEAQPDPGSST